MKEITLDNFDEYSKIFGEQTDAEDFRQKALEFEKIGAKYRVEYLESNHNHNNHKS